MQLHLKGTIFWAESSYEEKDQVKQAGLWWHGQGCRLGCQACRVGLPFRIWWTPYTEKAARLVMHADHPRWYFCWKED